jgi:hypothetical protein
MIGVSDLPLYYAMELIIKAMLSAFTNHCGMRCAEEVR